MSESISNNLSHEQLTADIVPQRRPEARAVGYVKLGKILQIMGKEDGQAALDRLVESERRNNDALRRLGLPRRRG